MEAIYRRESLQRLSKIESMAKSLTKFKVFLSVNTLLISVPQSQKNSSNVHFLNHFSLNLGVVTHSPKHANVYLLKHLITGRTFREQSRSVTMNDSTDEKE